MGLIILEIMEHASYFITSILIYRPTECPCVATAHKFSLLIIDKHNEHEHDFFNKIIVSLYMIIMHQLAPRY
jgi:hypothetical protein